ncbi:MAG: hypothetical protein KC910_27580, partial [Candidatus Eremiobacteraeota bacterium]|nr:hypothetical protein [Candidatus Eremiobacteraeota bacterium]
IDLHDTARNVLIDEDAGRLYVETHRMFRAYDLDSGQQQGTTWLPGWRQEGVVGRDGLLHVEGGREVKTFGPDLEQVHAFKIPFAPSRTSYLRHQDTWVFEDTDDRSPNQTLITDREGNTLYQSPGEAIFLDTNAPGDEGWMIQRVDEGRHELVHFQADRAQAFPCPSSALMALPAGDRVLLLETRSEGSQLASLGWRVVSQQGEELGSVGLDGRQPGEVCLAGDRVYTLDLDPQGELSLSLVDPSSGTAATIASFGQPEKTPLVAVTDRGNIVVASDRGVSVLDPQGKQLESFEHAWEARQALGGKLISRTYSFAHSFFEKRHLAQGSGDGWDTFLAAAKARFSQPTPRNQGPYPTRDGCLNFAVPVEKSEVLDELGLPQDTFDKVVSEGGEMSRQSTLPELGHTFLDLLAKPTFDKLVTNETGTYRVKPDGSAQKVWGTGFSSMTTVALPVGIGDRVYLLQGDDQGEVALVPEKRDILPAMRFGLESAVKGLELAGGHLMALGADGSLLWLQPTLKPGEKPFTVKKGDTTSREGDIELGPDVVVVSDFSLDIRQD